MTFFLYFSKRVVIINYLSKDCPTANFLLKIGDEWHCSSHNALDLFYKSPDDNLLLHKKELPAQFLLQSVYQSVLNRQVLFSKLLQSLFVPYYCKKSLGDSYHRDLEIDLKHPLGRSASSKVLLDLNNLSFEDQR